MMNDGLHAPRARWTRPSEFLVYLVPVGGISTELFASYARLLRAHHELPLRSLTRPGGYAAELSPFRSLDWGGPGALRFRFVSTTERVDSCDGEDAHASRRVVGVLGVCHCPSLPLGGGLKAAHAQFEASVGRFPGLLMHKCFAFEHDFDDATARECATLSDLVMFPVHHELEGTGESTVSLHLQVVMDTLAVTILMSLESAIRSATTTAAGHAAALEAGGGDPASALLDTNVEPQQSQALAQMQHSATAAPPLLPRDGTASSGSALSSGTPPSRSSFSSTSAASPLGVVAGSLSSFDPRNRRRKRQLARREKLLGDYCVLVSCVPDALEHYTSALEMLREEERRSGGAPGDALWLAAALESYAFCLYVETQDRFSPELVEKASEAVALYAKAGTSELESLLIESLGWYYVGVASTTLTQSSSSAEAKAVERVWAKRLLWDALERGLSLSPELQTQRQVEFLVQASRMLESVGHRRRMAFFLHEATSLLLTRNAPHVDAQMRLLLSPSNRTGSPQRQRDLQAALALERLAAAQLGIRNGSGRSPGSNELPWEVTTQYRKSKAKVAAGRSERASPPDDSWLIIRFHVLRQLLTTARMLGDALLIGTYCLQLLEMLVWCESIAVPPTIGSPSSSSPRRSSPAASTLLVDHLQQPASSLRASGAPLELSAAGLHAKSSVYYSPPPGIDTKPKRNFITSPSTTMSNAAASISSTLTNTPRILATPRQQFSAAVSAISTKASPAFTSFAHGHHHNGATAGRAVSGEDRSAALKVASTPESRGIGGAETVSDSGGPKSVWGGGVTGSEAGGKRPLDILAAVPAVWNLRSKTEIAKIERKLLGLLESECTALRSSEQVQLPTFLRVNKLKLRSGCNLQHPFRSRATTLDLFGVQSVSSQQAPKSDFFYSPFEKQKKLRSAEQRGGDANDDDDEVPATYERGFPVYERIELQMVLSNPTGVAVKLQQVKAWVTFVDGQGGTSDSTGSDGSSSSSSSSSAGVECYPCSFALEPYEKRKTVVLGIQPLRVGTFHVRGCFLKTFNVTTSFTLEAPVSIRVVGELPMVALSLRESGSMTLVDGDSVSATHQQSIADLRIAMFSSEKKQCVVRIRSIGNRQITNCRLAVTVQQRQGVKKTCVVFNNLPSTTTDADADAPSLVACADSAVVGSGSEDTFGKVDMQAVTLRCGKVASSLVPTLKGGYVNIPFEVSLRRSLDQADPLEEDVQLEWSFIYGDDTCSEVAGAGNEADAVFYRESKLVLRLVSLPSLTLRSVSLFPCCPEEIPSERQTYGEGTVSPLCLDGQGQRVMTDHSFCVIVVHVVNPTETAFRFRLRRRCQGESDLADDDAVACEAEIGRQCSRRFVVEIPRLEVSRVVQGSTKLVELLNTLLEMEWETFFGTNGTLRCEDCHVGSIVEQERAKLELTLPLISFEISSPSEESASGQRAENGHHKASDLIHRKDVALPVASVSFFHTPHLRTDRRATTTGLFRYVPITFVIRRHLEGISGEQGVLSVEIEVVIAEGDKEDDRDVGDHVMVVGTTKTQIQWSGQTDEAEKRHEIQCMFLSEGVFQVTVCGRVLGSDTQQVGAEVWSHRPIREQQAAHAEKTVGCEENEVERIEAVAMVQDRAETGEYFQVRRLLWDELKHNVRASEEQELRGAIGSSRIAENEV
ncbi:hypothetical protein BBJ28_00015198 [Nothophytophthora sp. Chile5]|nr:hypothetical protein BBJ28_00015198 [Nothophytophthora sp. Chile5]